MFEQTFKNIDDKLWKDAGCSTPSATPSALAGTSPKYDGTSVVFGGGRVGAF
ncbi:MAG TPA: hypothetical protein PKE35_03175 [Anaerolineales bacterium]|nr:hypothetical protein [Anaerolineales bacterium]HMV95529.1 hypothetical protein [Anaerolineales bacterium]HMX73224.1 hypothetical protein [Anaerolineales bacterium]HMZ43322.1 hypothetical protein [Anaerolineales bacterium]HNA54684.1 hypothetical protein [Anaerolineales bacterium]